MYYYMLKNQLGLIHVLKNVSLLMLTKDICTMFNKKI